MIITTDKEMRDRDPHDFYPTPLGLCDAALQILDFEGAAPRILDPGAGAGPWGQAARRRWPAAEITGIEVRDVPQPEAYDRWIAQTSFVPTPAPRLADTSYKDEKTQRRARAKYEADLYVHRCPVWRTSEHFDLIIGNPPYEYAEEFTRRALQLLAPEGRIVYLFRLAFLEGQDRGVGLWLDHPPYRVATCSRRPSFTGDGKTDSTAYACYYWNHDHQGDFAGSWLTWSDVAEGQLLMDLAA